ncbi:hypothetical protein [Salinisphaera sp. PC39]|uniref:hypothetical protein n=1 Tax=Salinisphaera sp. PC39 TaxID=1304156 RepID=UPI003342853D
MIVVSNAKHRVGDRDLREQAPDQGQAHGGADAAADLQAGEYRIGLQVENGAGQDLRALDIVGG